MLVSEVGKILEAVKLAAVSLLLVVEVMLVLEPMMAVQVPFPFFLKVQINDFLFLPLSYL
jgi:hypothetical protein